METPFLRDLENGTEIHFLLIIFIASCLEAEIRPYFFWMLFHVKNASRGSRASRVLGW